MFRHIETFRPTLFRYVSEAVENNEDKSLLKILSLNDSLNCISNEFRKVFSYDDISPTINEDNPQNESQKDALQRENIFKDLICIDEVIPQSLRGGPSDDVQILCSLSAANSPIISQKKINLMNQEKSQKDLLTEKNNEDFLFHTLCSKLDSTDLKMNNGNILKESYLKKKSNKEVQTIEVNNFVK